MTSINFKSIRHAVFDAYGTLFDVHSATSRYQVRLGKQAEAVSTIWRTKQLEYTWLRSLMQCYVDFWIVTQDALDYALDSEGIDDNSLRQDLLRAYHDLACYPEVPDTLSKLKQMGLGTAILSNGSPEMLEAGVRNSKLGKFLDYIISVDIIKIFKPSPRMLGMFQEQQLLLFRIFGPTNLYKLPKVFPELPLWKLILLMLFWNNLVHERLIRIY